jgi:hypothetical protein
MESSKPRLWVKMELIEGIKSAKLEIAEVAAIYCREAVFNFSKVGIQKTSLNHGVIIKSYFCYQRQYA